MASQPTVGGSVGTWGTELNNYLSVSLASDGKVADGAETSTSAAPTADAGVANKKYVDDSISGIVSVAGSDNSTGETSIGNLTFKWGLKAVAANSTASVDFTDESLTDNTATFQAFVTYQGTDVAIQNPALVSNLSSTGFDITNGHSASRNIAWLAIGRNS